MPIHHLDTPESMSFDFAFDPVFRLAALPFGVRTGNAVVELAGRRLHVRFGPWRLDTTVDNIAHVARTGPYTWPKVIGPPRLSFADSGITFASNATAGVCIRLLDPVRSIEPLGWLRHDALTVTVARPQELIDALETARGEADDLVQAESDDLAALTAKELRALAGARGFTKVSSMKKDDLVGLLLATKPASRVG